MRALVVGRGLVALSTALIVSVPFSACSSTGDQVYYNQLFLTARDIAVEEHETAYDILTWHRRLIVTGDVIGFKGGDDRQGYTNQYSVPLLVVNEDPYIQATTQVLRLIPAADVASIRLYHASEVPPRYRRPGAEGGIIEIITISGTRPPG